MGTIKLSNQLKPVLETTGPHSHFFGYYYNNPLDPKGEKLLAHRTDFDGRELQPGDQAEVGYFTVADNQWHRFGTTEAFNWQDGAMLQWIPGKEGTEIVYNLIIDGGCKGCRLNLETGEALILEKPIYALHPSGKWAIGVNFSRISLTRPGYGYRETEGILSNWQGSIHPEDGFFSIDLESGISTRLLTTTSVAAVDSPVDAEPDSMHYLHHPMWNPEGSRFLFLHRYTIPDGSFKTRLFSASAKGDDLYHFPDANLFSHAAWRNNEEFTIWSVPTGGIMDAYSKYRKAGKKWVTPIRYCWRLGKKFLRSDRVLQQIQRNGYYEMVDKTPEKKAIAHGSITMDGHPSWYQQGKQFLVDTYQDKDNLRHLLTFDPDNESVELLGSFHSPFNNCGYRCDLHPRVDPDGNLVCIDSAHSGRRQLYLYRIYSQYD